VTVIGLPRRLRRAAVRVRGRLDVVTVLSLYVVLLVAVPSRFVVGPLGGAGAPSLLLGVCCLLWWFWFRLRGVPVAPHGPAPVRVAAGFLAAAAAASYIAACIRPINGTELGIATLALINIAGWLGALLLSHDGLISDARMRVLLGRLVLLGAALAVLGLIQFATHRSWVDQITIPGLTENNSFVFGAQTREGFTRPSGTAIHPLEFGGVLAMTLPLAVASSVSNRAAGAVRRWSPPILILIAVALSNSRSAFVCAAVGLAVVVFALDREARRLALAGLTLVGVGVFLLVPGMLGSILGLFTGIGSDSSARSRFDSYSIAAAYAEHSALFGRGLGTFLPRYRIFDNEYLLLLVELGLVGLLSFIVLIGTAIWVGIRMRKAEADPSNGLMIQALVGSVAAGAASLALFDAFSFPMVPGLLFLLIGLIGSMHGSARHAEL
jgi:O-antigen ligase